MPPPPKDLRARGRKYSAVGEEARQHFEIFNHPGFKGERARCHHCNKELRFARQVQSLLEHIAVYPDPSRAFTAHPFRTRKGRCTHCEREMPNSQLQAHRHICPKMKQPCGNCGKRIVREAYRQHGLECKKHFFGCPRCKKKGFPVAEREEHLNKCQKFKCTQCRRPFPLRDKEEHSRVCEKFYCNRGHRTFPRTEKDEHQRTCESFECTMCGKPVLKTDRDWHKSEECPNRMCGKCRGRMPRDEYDTHLEACPFGPHGCSSCNKTGMIKEELNIHMQSCQYKRGNACRKIRIPSSEYAEHRKTCQWRHCYRCRKTTLVEDVEVHLMECFTCSLCGDPDVNFGAYLERDSRNDRRIRAETWQAQSLPRLGEVDETINVFRSVYSVLRILILRETLELYEVIHRSATVTPSRYSSVTAEFHPSHGIGSAPASLNVCAKSGSEPSGTVHEVWTVCAVTVW